MKATLQGSKEGEWRGGTSGVYGWEAYSARNKGILLEKQHLQGQLFGAGLTHNTSSAAWKSEPFSFCGSLCTSTTSWATLSIFYKVYFIGMSQDTSSPRTHRACWWIGCSSPPPGEWLGRNPAQRGIAGRAGRTWSEEEKKKKNKKWERFDSAHQDHNFLSYFIPKQQPKTRLCELEFQLNFNLTVPTRDTLGPPYLKETLFSSLGTKKQQIIPKARATKPGFVSLLLHNKRAVTGLTVGFQGK